MIKHSKNQKQLLRHNGSLKTVAISICLAVLILSLASCISKAKREEILTNIASNLLASTEDELNNTNLDEDLKTKLPDLTSGSKCSSPILIVNDVADTEYINTSSNLKIKRSKLTDLTAGYLSERLKKCGVNVDSNKGKIIRIFLKECGIYGFVAFKAHMILSAEIPEYGFNKTYEREAASAHFSRPIPVAFSNAIHLVVQDLLEDPEFQSILKCQD